MKAFVFRLDSVLTLRIREEEKAHDIFANAARIQAQAARDLADGRTALEQCHHAIVSRRAGATTRSEQMILIHTLQQQQAQCVILAGRLAAAEREAAQRRTEFLAARMKRETLSRLKERQSETHRVAQTRAEDAALGDLITARHARNLREVLR